ELCQRRRRLSNGGDAGSNFEARAKLIFRPIEDRLPGVALASDELLRPVGAVAKKIALGEGERLVAHLLRTRSDVVGDTHRKARQRHRRKNDLLALRAPLVRDGIRQPLAREIEIAPRRRLDALAVEQNAIAPRGSGRLD